VLAQTPANLEFKPMTDEIKPLPFDLKAINGLSAKNLVSHNENNYIRAVKASTRSVFSWLSSTMLKPPYS
jgi:hypothetical protein